MSSKLSLRKCPKCGHYTSNVRRHMKDCTATGVKDSAADVGAPPSHTVPPKRRRHSLVERIRERRAPDEKQYAEEQAKRLREMLLTGEMPTDLRARIVQGGRVESSRRKH